MGRRALGVVIFALLFFGVFSSGFAEETPPLFLGDPALSPDGGTLAFEYEGDIWTGPAKGGEARRLTLSVAFEKRPIFSPDGEWIVFSGTQYGNLDLFVMPSKGGRIRRLTYGPASDLACSFSPDGEYVYFYSWGDYRNLSFDLFRIPFEGGTPVRVAWAFRSNCYSAAVSPDGSKVCFVSRSSNSSWSRRGFRGPSTAELYLADNTVPFSNLRRLTRNMCQDFLPQWTPDGRAVWFASDRDGEYNLYLAPLDGEGEPKKVTRFERDGIRWFTVAARTGEVVVLRRYRLYSLDPASGETKLIPIRIYAPPKYTLPERRSAGEITEYALSPDGKKIAFVRGHDVFVASPAGGYAARLTDTPARECHIEWMPDSRRIVFNRLEGGAMGIVLLDTASRRERIVAKGRPNRFTPLPDPGGEYLYCQADYDRIVRIPLDGSGEETVVKGVFPRRLFSGSRRFDLTAGGKGLVYCEEGEAQKDLCLFLPLDGKRAPVLMTRIGGDTAWGGFTPDYSLFWFYCDLDGTWRLYRIRLGAPPPPPPSPRAKLEDLLWGRAAGKIEKDGKRSKPSLPPPEAFENLAERTEPMFPTMKGGQYSSALMKDGRRMLFVGDGPKGREIYLADLESPDAPPKRLTGDGSRKGALSVDTQGRWCYYMTGGDIHRLDIERGKSEKLAFQGADRVRWSLRETGEAVLEEMLWLLDYGFYDPAHHGADIEMLRAKYLPLVRSCTTQDQLDRLLRDLLADLNSSHMGITLQRQPVPAPPSEKILLGGFSLDPARSASGSFVVEHVVEGTPAARLLRPGDRITAVAGTPLTARINLFDLFRKRENATVPLRVAGGDGRERRVFLPLVSTSSLRKLALEEWVKDNRRYVEDRSGGRIGYLWVSRMYDAEYERFVEEMSRYLSGFEGVIVDFRFNSGGRTAHKLVEALDDEPWLFERMRGGRKVAEEVLRGTSFQMPVVGLFNQSSFSNAEMMCCGFRLRKIGPTVGEPTGGGVIGTWSKTLVDGSKMRLPRFAVFEHDGRNLEGSPTRPDYIVEKTVVEDMKGLRPQLDKAMELILSGAAAKERNSGK